MPFAPYDYIILYNPYKVNNTDCTFCKIRNDYYIVYNAKWGTAVGLPQRVFLRLFAFHRQLTATHMVKSTQGAA